MTAGMHTLAGRPAAWLAVAGQAALALAPPTSAPAAPRTGGVPVQVRQAGHCSAFLPANWTFGGNPQASTAEAISPDRTMYAGWGVVAIDTAQRPFYGDLYGPPEVSIRYLTTQVVASWLGDRSGVRYVGEAQRFLGYFTLRRVESSRHAGYVFYRIYPGGSSQAYVESVYFALASKAQFAERIGVSSGVAVSIRCVTRLVSRAEPSGRRGGSPRAGCGGEGTLRGYQKELGTQYAHSASGQNFLLDPSRDWNENGPQGPGFYRRVGNDYEKLELGRSDDC